MKNRIIIYTVIGVIHMMLGQVTTPKASANLILNGSFENGPTANPTSYYNTEMGRAYRQSPPSKILVHLL